MRIACLLLDRILYIEDTEILQSDLQQLENWESTWQMEFHPGKCHVLHITRSSKKVDTPYQLKGHTLAVEKTSTYLGVDISSDLRWNSHIDRISNKSNKLLGFVKRNIKAAPRSTKQMAYRALVRPVAEYASAIWDRPTHSSGNTRSRGFTAQSSQICVWAL